MTTNNRSGVRAVQVDGKAVDVPEESPEYLLEFLRETAGVTSVRAGCEIGVCGTCTVLVNGRAVSSCLYPMGMLVESDQVSTVAGLRNIDEKLSDTLVDSFAEFHAFQCGYCIPGMVVSAFEMLSEGDPEDGSTLGQQLNGNLCRCGCYTDINRAVERTRRIMKAAR